MSDFVEYSRGLMDAAKGFRTHALGLEEGEVKQAFLRAALLHACSFLEAHLNYMAVHFTDNTMFSLHEKGVLLEKEVRFDQGAFRLSNTLKISRITDRIDLLLSKCSTNPAADKAGWYPDVACTLKTRNSLVHPKDAHTLSESDVQSALVCVLKAADKLYNVVFGKGLPYAKKGIEGGLDLSAE
jgi:hypothetical protein